MDEGERHYYRRFFTRLNLLLLALLALLWVLNRWLGN